VTTAAPAGLTWLGLFAPERTSHARTERVASLALCHAGAYSWGKTLGWPATAETTIYEAKTSGSANTVSA